MFFALSPLIAVIIGFSGPHYLWQDVDVINIFSAVYITILCFSCAVKAVYERRTVKGILSRYPVFIFFGCFIVLVIVSTVINRSQPYALSVTWRREMFLTYILYAGGYFGCCAMIDSRRVKSLLIRTMQAVSLIQAVLVFFDCFVTEIGTFHLVQYPGDITSVFTNSNFYAYYLTIVVLVSAALFTLVKDIRQRIFDAVCFTVNGFMLMRTDTTGCFLAVLAGMVFLYIYMLVMFRRSSLTVILLTCAFIVLFFINALIDDSMLRSLLTMFRDMFMIAGLEEGDIGDAGTGRMRLWMLTIGYIGERPLTGWGSEGILDRLTAEGGTGRPHNEYLQYAAFFGIPAALCYISGVISVFVKSMRRKAKADPFTAAALAASFGYLISAFFGNTMSVTAPYFFCMLGLSVRTCRDGDAGSPDSGA